MGILIGGMTLINHYIEDHNATKVQLKLNATTALMLEHAHEDVRKAYFKTSIAHIDRAVQYMEFIKPELDAEHIGMIDRSISQLKSAMRAIESGFYDEEKLNEVFNQTLSTLALSHLKISEEALQNANTTKAEEALHIATTQLNSAKKFATGALYQSEEALCRELAIIAGAQELKIDRIQDVEHSLKGLIEH